MSISYGRIAGAALVVLALAAAVPTDRRTVTALPGDPALPTLPTLEVTAADYAFIAPDTVTAGPTRVRMTSRGREPHILEIVRLADGHTAGELLDILAAGKPLPAWATHVGGPGVPPPGGASEIILTLEPGRYAFVCPIPSPGDHEPHLAKGMVRALTVLPAPAGSPRPAEPKADVVAVLDDYSFGFTPAPAAGRRTIRVENRAAQPHELILFRLPPGKRAADVVQWARTLTGPPPGTPVGGTTALARGETVHLQLDLEPGTYALICFLPDAKDGKAHHSHGMLAELVIR